MSNYIDIEVVIDTVSLLGAYPNPSKDPHNPTGIDHTSFSYMIAQTAFVNSGQASGNLSIKALVNDTIRWRSLSLSGNADQSAEVYNIQQFAGQTVTSPVFAIESTPYVPLPTINDGRNTDPPTFTTVTENDYFLQATVTGHGTEQYKVFFYVTMADQGTGKPVLKGYFYWDPTITVP
ncbi:MAG TPA: inclusion body family protein [Aliidongia sp.]|nr:inclusion body family protein [Aliidongia sp.]